MGKAQRGMAECRALGDRQWRRTPAARDAGEKIGIGAMSHVTEEEVVSNGIRCSTRPTTRRIASRPASFGFPEWLL